VGTRLSKHEGQHARDEEADTIEGNIAKLAARRATRCRWGGNFEIGSNHVDDRIFTGTLYRAVYVRYSNGRVRISGLRYQSRRRLYCDDFGMMKKLVTAKERLRLLQPSEASQAGVGITPGEDWLTLTNKMIRDMGSFVCVESAGCDTNLAAGCTVTTSA